MSAQLERASGTRMHLIRCTGTSEVQGCSGSSILSAMPPVAVPYFGDASGLQEVRPADISSTTALHSSRVSARGNAAQSADVRPVS